MEVIFKEVEMYQIPITGGMQLFNPSYRDMELNTIKLNSNINNEYVPYGYNLFLFVRSNATIYAFIS